MPAAHTASHTATNTKTLSALEYAHWLVSVLTGLPGHLSSHVRGLRVWEGRDTGIVRIYRGEDYVQVDCGENGGHYGHALRAVVGRDRGFQAALRATGHLVVDGTVEISETE